MLSLLLSGCATIQRPAYDKTVVPVPEKDRLVIWMLSDIQPESVPARKDFEKAVEDVSAHVPGIDLAVMAGDLLQSRSTAEDFDWFIDTREKANIPHWYELAGNHDVRNHDLFQKYFPRPSHYAVSCGNVLILLLSDETPSSETNISNPTFEW